MGAGSTGKGMNGGEAQHTYENALMKPNTLCASLKINIKRNKILALCGMKQKPERAAA